MAPGNWFQIKFVFLVLFKVIFFAFPKFFFLGFLSKSKFCLFSNNKAHGG